MAETATAVPSTDELQLGSIADPDALDAALEASILRESFALFAVWAWPLVTGSELVVNRAMFGLAVALQNVADGKVTRLLIALPPGVGKSTMLACYAAWRIARDPGWRSIHASHSFELSATESRRVRRLVEHDAYRRLFPAVRMRTDENTIGAWFTASGGCYFAVGTDTRLTGRRANEAVVDDPLAAVDRFSRAARESLWTWFGESLSTRLDGDHAPFIVVMQRLDRDDLIGRLIAAGGWTLVKMPAEFPDGELLAPTVLSREKLDAIKAQIGTATYETQYKEEPSSDEGATIKRIYFRFHHAPHVPPIAPRPSGCDTTHPAIATPEEFERLVIVCDLTFGSKVGSFACAQVWGAREAARFLLAQWRERAGLLASVEAILELKIQWPDARVIIEKAANGAGAAEELEAVGLSDVVLVPAVGSKDFKIGIVSGTFEAGNVLLPLGASWLPDFVEELAGATVHKDQQDCAAIAIHDLNTNAAKAWPNYSALRRTGFR